MAATTVADELHTPEKLTATILPVTVLVYAWQPSSVGAVPSTARMRSPVISKLRGPALNGSLRGVPADVTSAVLVPAVHRNMRIRGRAPSAGVDMSALLRSPVFAPACEVTSSGSPATPPRPKLSSCPLAVASVKPESYHQSCCQLTRKNALTAAAFD